MPQGQARRTGQQRGKVQQGKTGQHAWSGWTPGVPAAGMTGGGTTSGARGRLQNRGGGTTGNVGNIQHLSTPRGNGNPQEFKKMTTFLENYVGFLNDLGLISNPDVAYNIGVRLASTGTI